MKRGVNLSAIVILLFVLIGLIWGVDALIRALKKSNSENSSILSASSEITSDVEEISTDVEGLETTLESGVPLETVPLEEKNYDTIELSKSDMSKGSLVLVNSVNKYMADISGELISFRGKKNETYRLKSYELMSREEVINSLNSMFSDFYNHSSLKNILVISTYIAQQENDISTGYSVNIRILNDDSTNLPFTGSGDYSWIIENCYNYGLIVRYPAEKSSITGLDDPSYLRYVGKPHSLIIKQNNFCLEEYTDFLKDYSYDNPLEYENYKIYYVKAVGDKTDAKVPKDSTYYVSGNNVDGFIITVENAVS
ncbi:MAG TPA: M15 family metallopeptidase [Clostridiales bacterium]|nr:M15 family metallopeptidase [Clostridiales bacterium]